MASVLFTLLSAIGKMGACLSINFILDEEEMPKSLIK